MSETALQVIDETSVELQPLNNEQVRRQIDLMLTGSGLTCHQLLLDMGAYLTANPKVARQATAPTLFNALYVAARCHASFGDGGFWLIPGIQTDDEDDERAPKGKGIRAQPSEKLLTARAKDAGWDVAAYLVWGDQDVEVHRDEAGAIVGVEITGGDDFADRDQDDLRGGVVVATNTGTHERRIEALSKQQLDIKRDHSAAAKKGKAPAWKADWRQMYLRSLRAHMDRLLVPVIAKSPGMVSGMIAPIEEPESGERPLLPQTSADVAAELESRGDPTPGGPSKPSARAVMTADGLREVVLKPEHFDGELRALLESEGESLAKTVYQAYREAFLRLAEMPEALEIARQEGRGQWAKLAEGPDVDYIQMLGKAFWESAERAGYPQPTVKPKK